MWAGAGPVTTTPDRYWPDTGHGGSGYAIWMSDGLAVYDLAVSPLAGTGSVFDVHDIIMEHGCGLVNGAVSSVTVQSCGDAQGSVIASGEWQSR